MGFLSCTRGLLKIPFIFSITILEPEILGNHNINTDTTLLLIKTIVN